MTTTLAIDPGTTQSGWVVFDGKNVVSCGISPNEDVLFNAACFQGDLVAIEMIASYGMPVGAEVFETCVWIGRFIEAAKPIEETPRIKVELIYRRDVKIHLCGSPRAKDGNIRQALIDKLGVVGTKKNPGPLFGMKSHAWAALGVAVTALET
jgi:hypothetical protein